MTTTMTKSTIPPDARRITLRPLALGEATGHHHSMVMDPECAIQLADAVEMYELDAPDGVKTFLRITTDGVSVQHQEHKTHPIAPGDYTITIQREFTDWGQRQVID